MSMMSSTPSAAIRRIFLLLIIIVGAFAASNMTAAGGPGIATAAQGGTPGPPHPINPPACPENPWCTTAPEPPPPPPPRQNPPSPGPDNRLVGGGQGGSSVQGAQTSGGGKQGGGTAQREAAGPGPRSPEVVVKPKAVKTEKAKESGEPVIAPVVIEPTTEASNPERSTFADRLLSPTELHLDAEHLAEGGMLALLLVALLYLPVTIFNKATEKNHEAITTWLERPRAWLAAVGGLIPFAGHPLGTLAAGVLASTALFAFIDPGFPSKPGALEYLIGMLLGFALVSTIFFSTWKIVLDKLEPESTGRWRVFPPYILLAALLVVMARLAHFLPGVVLGTVAEYEPKHRLSVRTAGIRVAITYGVLIAVGVAAWFAWIPVSNAAHHEGASSTTLILDSMLAITFVTSLESVAFGLIPMTFLDGNDLFRWRKWLWGAMWGGSVLWFAVVILQPALSIYGEHASHTQAIWLGLMFAGLMLVALTTWVVLRFRQARLERFNETPSGP